MAGLTLLAIAVPLNIGYAQVAGLPPTAGLYALVLPTLVYALAASSRQVVASPDAAAAALVFSSLVGLQGGGVDLVTLAAAQAMVGGVILLAAGAFKLGFLANFLSKPILVGFVGGLAAEILVSQVAKMLGLKLPGGSEFIESCAHIVTSLAESSAWSLAVAVSTLLVLVVGRKLRPSLPWPLLALVMATLVTGVAGLDDKGVSVLGHVPVGLPGLSLPSLEVQTWVAIIPSAAALSLITMAEGLLIGRSYAVKNRYQVSPNRDLVAFGAANVAAGFSSSFTMGSSTSRTAAMQEAGSRSQLPSIVVVAGAAMLMLFGTELIASIPGPAIGAIVTVAIVNLLGFRELLEIRAIRRSEFLIAVTCFAGVLLAGPLKGLILAFVLSIMNLIRRAARPTLDVLPGDSFDHGWDTTRFAGESPDESLGRDEVVVVRMAAPLFFANALALTDAVRHAVDEGRARGVILDLEAVSDIDVTGGEALSEVLAWLTRRGVAVTYSRVRPDLISTLENAALVQSIPLHPTNREAVAALRLSLRSGTDADTAPAPSGSVEG